ncbi:MAG: 3-hydroxyacyl-CoA dehydrogenase NAD-binding domain-containing protein [Bacteroidia bacterium]
MKRTIRKVAVLGSGIMGSRIACHFANIGLQVLLLDIAPKELTEEEKAKGLTLDNPAVKNKIVNSALQTAIKTNPSPLYKKSDAKNIITGNFDDDLQNISDCDWIIEAIIEIPEIKIQLFDKVEKYRKQGTLITTNTSGIPIKVLEKGRSDDFRQHFCGTHFFNPPRYLQLLEIIPGKETKQDVIDFLMHYGDLYLGKTTVLCKDTPAFIANRIGVYSIMKLFHIVDEMNLSVEDVDKLTGPVLGRPKSATFRTADVVGIDTLVKVAQGVYQFCPNDEEREVFQLPPFLQKMVEKKWFGEKTKQGFYKKIKDEKGKSEILSLDLKTLEYNQQQKTKYATLEAAKSADEIKDRIKVLFNGKDKAGEFYKKFFLALFNYVSHRIPEVSDHIYSIDAAMRAGFGWETGPFETWDILGVKEIIKLLEENNYKPAEWVYELIKTENNFYKEENGKQTVYEPLTKNYISIPGTEAFIILGNISNTKTIWKNSGSSVIDLNDGIICFEWHTKMNTIGGEVIEGINKAIEIAEKDYRGLVIANEGANFSVGANLALVYMLALEQEFDEIDFAARAFQNVNMRMRYSSIPVVVAPHGMALGGGCEMTLHADKVQAAAETYIGLVEFGVGLIPAGGGTKEFVLRASDEFKEGDIELNILKNKFLAIGMAKVSTSAKEAFDLGILVEGRDDISINKNRLITDAKAVAMRMAEEGYVQPTPRKDIKVLGRTGLGMVYAGANSMYSGHFISEHDKLISQKLGYIMCGGDLSAPTLVSEQYLLDLERDAFLSLCGERKTLERIQSILTTGKPLRN